MIQMILVRQIKIPILEDTNDHLLNKIYQKLKVSFNEVKQYKIVKKSIDARDKKNIFYVYEVQVEVSNEEKVLKHSSNDIVKDEKKEYVFPKKSENCPKEVLIVGSGPAGLFCSYMLAKNGIKPIIFERGDAMDERISQVEKFFRDNVLDPNSNIQFGEGGAGTFSDGKLNTLTKDKFGRNQKVFEIFVENGAPEEILYMNNPHIGTDILRDVIKNMREKILSLGGEFHYRSRVTNVILENNHVVGLEINHKEIVKGNTVVFAIGHSARDTFQMLHEKGLFMKQKNFAVGVRIEHPKEMIDISQYGEMAKYLPSANYKLTYTTHEGRGVYSFCMCPGGYVVNASSEEKRLVVNGMSNYLRDAKNSNSALVVSVSPKDFGEELFSGMEFQRRLEEAAYKEGKGFIPVQLYKDFKDNTTSHSFGEYTSNTKGNTSFSNLRNVLPDFISNSILEAMPEFDKRIHGFAREDAILLGVETRTSSPIVMVRDENFVSNIAGLYPCGEGAGYAGGITTAAVDGIKVSESIVSN